MAVRQVSVFLENKEGRLYEMAKVLGEAGINMRALTVAETADYGVARLIVDRPEEALKVLRDAGFTVSLNEVIAVVLPDEPGGLAGALAALKEHSINVEYLYCFVTPRAGQAVDVMRVEQLTEAENVLKSRGFQLLEEKDLF